MLKFKWGKREISLTRKINKIKIIDILLLILAFISISITLVILGELIIRKELIDIVIWVLDNKLAFSLNVLGVFCILLFSSIITKNVGIGALTTGSVYIVLCIVNFYKYAFKGEFLSLYDFTLVREGVTIVKEFDIKLEMHILKALLIFIIIVIISYKIRFYYKKGSLLILALVSLVFSGSLLRGIYFNKSTLAELEIQQDNFFNQTNYIDNGLLVTLLTKTNDIRVKKPENYSRATISNILQKYYIEEENDIKTPNVIMIMNEAFFDITKVPGLDLSGDPLKGFHKYQEKHSSGNLIVPVFGGATAQTEYEVLTGNSVGFVGSDNIAYTNYVKPGMNSLVEIFKERDYTTLAIHPYIREFYKRDRVYEYLRFDKYISIDNIQRIDEDTKYISDMDTYKKLIEEIETRKTDRPVFTHIVTMQNHAPYTLENSEIEVLNQELSAETFEQVSGYVAGLKRSDQALKYLIDYFSNEQDPTIIIMYGDHGPILGDFYTEIGYTTQEKIDTMVEPKLYTVPLLIWSNYGVPQEKYENIDASYLGAVLLDILGDHSHKYFKVLEQVMPLLKAYNYNFILDADSNYMLRTDINEYNQAILDELWMLQYDRTFGKNYIGESQHE